MSVIHFNLHQAQLITPPRLLFLAVIAAGLLQFMKLWMPYLNGWVAVVTNALLIAVGFFVLFRVELTWWTLAAYVLCGLAAAGIHGTATKLQDSPGYRENPTPSGTPAQNYDKI